jgi:hypothetical protein
MKAKQRENNLRSRLRRFLRPPAAGHDRLLVFSLSTFNFTDGWIRVFAKDRYERSWA